MSNTEQRQPSQEEEDDLNIVDLANLLIDVGVRLASAGFGDILPEATVVKINPETYEKGNTKRNAWVESHLDDEFTIEYDPRWTDEPHIYGLAEDDSDPKWLFMRNELIVIERPEKEGIASDAEEENIPDNGQNFIREDGDHQRCL